jgi:hypothetical protein
LEPVQRLARRPLAPRRLDALRELGVEIAHAREQRQDRGDQYAKAPSAIRASSGRRIRAWSHTRARRKRRDGAFEEAGGSVAGRVRSRAHTRTRIWPDPLPPAAKAAEAPPTLRYHICMTSRAHKLIAEFFALPEDEQAEVLDAIVPADELDPEFVEELKRRVRNIQDGTAVVHNHEDVRREFRQILKR